MIWSGARLPHSNPAAHFLVWVAFTSSLTVVFARISAYNLGNYRPATNDEVELMSVGYKLATQGVLGSDLFAGFFGADRHYLMTLPLQHVLQAISFRLFGVGLAQARWVSLVAGVSIVWVVGWLAYRWYGQRTAIVCEVLLVAWASNLTQAANGLPLLGVARTARYDALAVAFVWLAIALLDATLRRPGRATGCGLGLCGGLAALTTLTGAFVVPLIGLNWLWIRGRSALADRTLYWIIGGGAVVVLPWLVYSLAYRADLDGQLAVYGGRWDVLNWRFYAANLVAEPLRYRDLPSSSSLGSWVLAVGVWPAAAYVAWRCRRFQAIGDRLVVSSLVTFEALLWVFDQTKTSLYAIVLLPSLCLAMAALLTGALDWAWRQPRPAWLIKVTSSLLAMVLAVVVGFDGVHAYQVSLTEAAQAGQYLGVGRQIDDGLPPLARVLGPERWWWALHDHPYVSVRSVWFQWTAAFSSTGRTPRFADWVTSNEADSIVVNDNIRDDVLDFPEPLQQQFWAFLGTCTTRVADLDDPTYLQIEIYEIARPSPHPASCT